MYKEIVQATEIVNKREKDPCSYELIKPVYPNSQTLSSCNRDTECSDQLNGYAIPGYHTHFSRRVSHRATVLVSWWLGYSFRWIITCI